MNKKEIKELALSGVYTVAALALAYFAIVIFH